MTIVSPSKCAGTSAVSVQIVAKFSRHCPADLISPACRPPAHAIPHRALKCKLTPEIAHGLSGNAPSHLSINNSIREHQVCRRTPIERKCRGHTAGKPCAPQGFVCLVIITQLGTICMAGKNTRGLPSRGQITAIYLHHLHSITRALTLFSRFSRGTKQRHRNPPPAPTRPHPA